MTKKRLPELIAVCRDMGIAVVAETIEAAHKALQTQREKTALETIFKKKKARTVLGNTLGRQLLNNPGCGLPKMREHARREILTAVWRDITPAYSVNMRIDPVVFFNRHLRQKFEHHAMPASCIATVAPNLSFIIKTRGRFAELAPGGRQVGN